MANTTEMILSDLANILRDQYFDDKWHEGTRPRKGLPKYMNWRSLETKGGKKTFQVKTRPYTGVRVGALEAALPTPQGFDGVKVCVNMGKATTDIKRLTGSIQYTEESSDIGDYDGLVSSLADELAMGLHDDFAELTGQLMWLGPKGRLFSFDGAAEDDDGTAIGNADVDFRFKVKNGSPTLAIPGLKIDLYNGATKKFGSGGSIVDGEFIITNVKYDNTAGAWYVYAKAADGTTAVTDATELVDGLDVYRSGMYDQSLLTFNDWFNVAADGGVDSIFRDDAGTAYDRTDPSVAAWWLPTTIGNTSLANMTLEIMDNLWPIIDREMGQAPQGLVMTGDPEMWQNIKRLMEYNKRSIIPMDSATAQVFGIDGMTDHYFIDPIIGKIGMTSDVYSPKDMIQIINPAEWGWIKSGPPKFIPNSDAGGIWTRVQDSSGNRYAAWTADLYMLAQSICFGPRLGNYRITNVRSKNT